MPIKTKFTFSQDHQHDSVTSKSEAKVCEKFATIQAIESSSINPPAPKKKTQKNKNKGQGPKQTRNFTFEEETVEGKKIKHKYSCTFSDPHNIKKLAETKHFAKYEAFRLNIDSIKIRQSHQIDKLVAANVLQSKLVPYDFQMAIALKVINEMNANAILADEVGLGKTIEAGLIMKELLLRGEIDSILIVSPKSLLSQWQEEMEEKFAETFVIANNHKINFNTADRVICSHNLLARKYDELASKNWDLVVVDEAHAFRNTHTKSRGALANLPKNHFLLLTATPICNKLTDLYSVMDLIEPGVFDSERLFISRFSDDAKSSVVRPEGAYQLRQTLRGIMCRTRREQTGIPFTKRYVDSRTLEPEESERIFFDKATQYLRDIYNNRFKTIEALTAENPNRKISPLQSSAILVFQAIALQQSFASSPEAAIQSLQRRQQRFPSEIKATNELIEMAKQVKSSKVTLLKQILKDLPNDQALIFCLRRITAQTLKNMLNEEFGKADVYLGNMSQNERDKVIADFKSGATKYLIATDSAAEGLNLQNCRIMFNFDLHWNPMKIEQRIGRIHRYKQDRDVMVFNITIKDTIDDYVLHILYQKIDLFTMTIGKMETVLAELKEGSQDIQKTIMNILLKSDTRLDIQKELEKLAGDLNVSKRNQELAEQFTQGVLD